MVSILERAVIARRESRRIAFRTRFDPGSQQDWCELIRDIAAMANSGGGIILFGVNRDGVPNPFTTSQVPDSVRVIEQLREYSDSGFSDVDRVPLSKDSAEIVALVIGEAITPIVFTKSGTYVTETGKEKLVFGRGAAYFRHGRKSVSGNTEDLAAAIDRRIQDVRKSWLSAVSRVIDSPVGAAIGVLPREIRDSDAPEATPIRIVNDPTAPAFRVIDYDKTHPYRQKEILSELQSRGLKVNQFDLRAVRHVYEIDSNPEFSHKIMYGSRQYSPKFLSWLLEQAEKNPNFFAETRQKFAPKSEPVTPPADSIS